MAESLYVGYDFKAKDKTLYECPICKKIIKQFTELPCSHATCRCCLEHWEQQRVDMLKQIGEGDPNVTTCITCNQVYNINDKHFSRASDRIIVNELEVLCQLHENGCQWFGTISDYQRHSDNECLVQSIHCRFNGCNEQFQRRFQNRHENSCSEQERNCDYCNNVVKHYNEKIHQQNECSRFPTKCSNPDCQQVFPRNEIEEHQQNDCLQQEISCIYADIGCDVKIKRCHLENHEKEFNTTHTKLLFKELRKTKEQLLATTKIAENAQSELKDTKSKLEATTKLAKDTQRELIKTKEELDILKEEMKTKEKKIEERCVVKPNPATAHKVSLMKAEVKVVNVARLMGELVQPNPPRTTQQTYAEKIQRVLNEINEGQLFHINDNECFFKLRIQQNYRKFCIQHVDDVTRYRNKFTEFTNDVVALNDLSSCYQLYVAIEKYDKKNCRSYVINVKECGKNRLLKYAGGCNVDIRWELYKNGNNEVIFYFKKK